MPSYNEQVRSHLQVVLDDLHIAQAKVLPGRHEEGHARIKAPDPRKPSGMVMVAVTDDHHVQFCYVYTGRNQVVLNDIRIGSGIQKNTLAVHMDVDGVTEVGLQPGYGRLGCIVYNLEVILRIGV